MHVFSPLLEGSRFQVYFTAQAQNDAPRIFVFLTYQAYQKNSNALFNLRLLLVYWLFIDVVDQLRLVSNRKRKNERFLKVW